MENNGAAKVFAEELDSRVGFRFRPSDLALIGVLERKRRNPLYDVRESAGDLSEMYMYGPGKEPWNLFSGIDEITELSDTQDPQRKLREKYVVTELNRIGKKNCSRLAGKGSWVDKSTKKPVYFRGREVGHWRTLTYEYSGDDGVADGKRHYYMNELHLLQPCNYVLCRVVKNLDKHCNIKFGTKRCREDDDQDFQPATKRSRHCEEESQASSSCSEIVQEEVEEYYTDAIDFSDYPEIPGFYPEVSNIPDMLGQNQEHQDVDCPEMQAMVDPQPQVPSMNDESSGPFYVPEMSGVGENQEPEGAEWCNFPMLADQGWLEEIMKIMQED